MESISSRTYTKVMKRVVELGQWNLKLAIQDQYLVKKKPVWQVAAVLGVSPTTLELIMKELDIPRRARRGRR